MNFEFERKCEARKEYEREWEESRRKAFKLIPVVNEADVNVITQICACKSFVLPLVCHWFSHNSMHNITMLGSLYIYLYGRRRATGKVATQFNFCKWVYLCNDYTISSFMIKYKWWSKANEWVSEWVSTRASVCRWQREVLEFIK